MTQDGPLFETFFQLGQALANIGVDASCGSCMSVFYTGVGINAPHTCEPNGRKEASSNETGTWLYVRNQDEVA